MSSIDRLTFGVIIALGLVVRIVPVLSAAGAVGDGGLFYSMIDDIRAAGMSVPPTTSYNELEIPFVYPPLALLSAAAIGQISGAETLDVLRWLPLLVSVLTVVAFAWLARAVLAPTAALAATFIYALMPHAYDWVIAGGGVTRGVGLLFALLAMAVAADRSRTSFRTAVVSGLMLGLAGLSHPQAAAFGAIGCLVLSCRPPASFWLRQTGIAVVSAGLVVLPWLVGVISTHGTDALLSAAHRLDPDTGLIRLLSLRFSGAPFMDVFAVAGVVGLVVSLARRQPRLAVFLLLTYLTGAGGGEFLGAVPWALLGGVGGAAVIALAVSATSDARRAQRRAIQVGLGALVLFLALAGSLGSYVDGSSKLQALSADQLAAMRWVSDNTDVATGVIVTTGDVWGDDEQTEWFPALARRHSLGTVQGAEWLGIEGYERQLTYHALIRNCDGSKVDCYTQIDRHALIFIPKGQLTGPYSPGDCCPAIRSTTLSEGYRAIYDGPGATVLQPVSADQ